MSKSQKILTDILSGRCDANIGFADLCYIFERAGFTRRPGKGRKPHDFSHGSGG